jgi:uncharacterized membrane protein YedE/YeeE
MIIAAALSVLAFASYLYAVVSWKQSALFIVGTLAGLVLYHAAFGFTGSWRDFIVSRRGRGLRAQMLMLAVTCAVFFPVLASGHFFGQAVRGSVSPVAIGVVVGAFMFGVGMQLGGGCASGTLYSAGGGDTRMVVTLLSFITGSVIGLAQLPWWEKLPAMKATSLVTTLGAPAALALCLSVFGAIAALTIVMERARHGALQQSPEPPRIGTGRVLGGPWPLVAGALGLAFVNIATLALAGRPWGVTSAFALWGTKALAGVGVNVAGWTYYSVPARAADLQANLFKDVTSVMDFGIVLGAMTAAMLAGRFAPRWQIPMRSLAAAVCGGLMLGYGSRIAYGCNIGAYFSGIASGSLHGWLWLPAAFAGNAAGTRVRPLLGLTS